jgi:hypothetical protein
MVTVQTTDIISHVHNLEVAGKKIVTIGLVMNDFNLVKYFGLVVDGLNLVK